MILGQKAVPCALRGPFDKPFRARIPASRTLCGGVSCRYLRILGFYSVFRVLNYIIVPPLLSSPAEDHQPSPAAIRFPVSLPLTREVAERMRGRRERTKAIAPLSPSLLRRQPPRQRGPLMLSPVSLPRGGRCLRSRRMRVREKPIRRISSVRSLTRPCRATLPHGEGFPPLHYYLFTLHFFLLPPPGLRPQARASEQPPDRAALGESLRCLRSRRMRGRDEPMRCSSGVRSLTRPVGPPSPTGRALHLFTITSSLFTFSKRGSKEKGKRIPTG